VENHTWEYTFDKPVKYKTLVLHPIKMKNYFHFMQVASILLIDKNSIPEVKIISMSYLEYLCHIHKESESIGNILIHLLRLVLDFDKEEDVEKISLFPVMHKFMVDGKMFDAQDFDNIRTIIIEQNGLTPPDETIQKELRDAMEDAAAFRRKLSGNKTAGIEDQMVALSTQTGFTLEYIYEMTIRKFIKAIERVDHAMHYKMYMAASLSGFVTFKSKSAIKHWLADLSKNKLDGLIAEEELESRLTGAI